MDVPENPYLLMTPGPLSTTRSVRGAMMRDWCTWDDDYNELVQSIRSSLQLLAGADADYTTVLMQGSGTFSVESVIGTALGPKDKLLVLANGAYGSRIAEIARYLRLPLALLDYGECGAIDLGELKKTLDSDAAISHVAVVHCETTTGRLNDIASVGAIVKGAGKVFIVDAMSSFAGVPMVISDFDIDFLVSSANKCIQGVPGFGFVIARRSIMEQLSGRARSLSLDLYAQWEMMEKGNGKWRYTSPTHTVRAFHQALAELEQEGGVAARAARYRKNQALLVGGMKGLGFECLLMREEQSPIITAFVSPASQKFDFRRFYEQLKASGFVIYPGKVTDIETFRIGNIGDVWPADIERLLQAVANAAQDFFD